MNEIPFWFHDRPKWVSGITKHTTCGDVLVSLVKAHLSKSSSAKSKSTSDLDLQARSTSNHLVLVEQWRGVERPLSNSSRILKLWHAWGEERDQVKFVVKKISSSSSSATAPTGATSSSTLPSALTAYASLPRRKTRRRNSRVSNHSRSSVTDTFHPSALAKKSSSSDREVRASDIEKLMRVIVSQGETIHAQLKRLQEREGQIENIEQEVHASRTKTAGKDYLLNAYLESSSDGEKAKVKVATLPRKSKAKEGASESVPECLQEMVEALSQVSRLNEKLEKTEETLSDLYEKVSTEETRTESRRSKSADSRVPDHVIEMDSARGEVTRLRTLNDKVGKEIDYNRRLISDMRNAFDERKALVTKLEQDVDHFETEGYRLEVELQRVRNLAERREFPPAHLIPLDVEDDDLLNDIMGGERHMALSSSQLYEQADGAAASVSSAAKLYEQMQRLHVKTGALELLGVPSSSCTDTSRINATGSPGSSTSGNSSSGCTGSEKSVRFSDRDMIMATPDLPPLPADDFPEAGDGKSAGAGNAPAKAPPAGGGNRANGGVSQFTKSILKSVDASGDLDSNSDTGLSSLHSSSDEGTYVLDTLV